MVKYGGDQIPINRKRVAIPIFKKTYKNISKELSWNASVKCDHEASN